MVRGTALLLALLCFIPAAAQAQQVRVSNLSDLLVPLWAPGDPDIVHDVDVCVYRQNVSGATRHYSVTGVGDPGFYLMNKQYRLPYSVRWDDGGAGHPRRGGSKMLKANAIMKNFDRARIDKDVPTGSSDCDNESLPTAHMRIVIRAADLDAAPDGTYGGVLTLVIAPD